MLMFVGDCAWPGAGPLKTNFRPMQLVAVLNLPQCRLVTLLTLADTGYIGLGWWSAREQCHGDSDPLRLSRMGPGINECT